MIYTIHGFTAGVFTQSSVFGKMLLSNNSNARTSSLFHSHALARSWMKYCNAKLQASAFELNLGLSGKWVPPNPWFVVPYLNHS
jgi:hypothetical protein